MRQPIDGQHRYENALSRESSPYLLQHAHNPVDWMPWGEPAFARARTEDKPLLVSVGYSTCHWCHVMEEESFEDEEIARAMNDGFVCVKVDREERPDVDALTMLAVQSMSGSGGWPSTVFMTADKQPFFAGTYFPPRDGARGARMGFLTIVQRLHEAWVEDRARVLDSASDVARELSAARRPLAPIAVSLDVVDAAVAQVAAGYDARHGGLLPAPKFPSSLPIRVLLRHHLRTGAPDSLRMAQHTFARMSAGGIHDQVGGGFHRYSTDERWLLPHFEKMLYDNAQLAIAGLELWQVTHDDEIERTVRDTLAWVEREMTSPEGLFFSATDADSLAPSGEREEGRFFSWAPEEVRAELVPLLGAQDTERVLGAWDVTTRGNFEGRSIPWLPRAVDEGTAALLERAKPALLRARDRRERPLLDDKLLAAWNGLMISAFARAGRALCEPRYRDVAERALAALQAYLAGPEGRLARSWKGGAARHAGMLDDHAAVCAAALDVFESTGSPAALSFARQLVDVIEARFADPARGGYFSSPDDSEELLGRAKETHDGSEPAGISLLALSLLRLSALLGDAALRQRAERAVESVGQVLARMPLALPEMLLAVEALHAERKEAVFVRDGDGGELERALGRCFAPHAVLVPVRQGERAPLPLAEGRGCLEGAATLYVCREGACGLPITAPDQVADALAR